MRESRTYGSVTAKAEWLSYSTNLWRRGNTTLTSLRGSIRYAHPPSYTFFPSEFSMRSPQCARRC